MRTFDPTTLWRSERRMLRTPVPPVRRCLPGRPFCLRLPPPRFEDSYSSLSDGANPDSSNSVRAS